MRRRPILPCRFPGQSVVEFALVSLILMLLVFGTIDLGRGVFARQQLTNAVREAARQGSITPAETDLIIAAAQRTSPGLGLQFSNFDKAASSDGRKIECANWGDAIPAVGDCGLASKTQVLSSYVLVCATYDFGLTAPRLLGFSTITMKDCAKVTRQ